MRLKAVIMGYKTKTTELVSLASLARYYDKILFVCEKDGCLCGLFISVAGMVLLWRVKIER